VRRASSSRARVVIVARGALATLDATVLASALDDAMLRAIGA
jgi:hypothetical protein